MNARILVADDAPEIRNSLKRTLVAQGHSVELAEDGIEAVETTRSWRPDLILLDLAMPRMGGLTACQHIREVSDAPIIVLSVMGEEQDKVRALDAGADDYVTKPFGMEELLARIRAVGRRAAPDGEVPRVRLGDLVVDLAAKRVTPAPGPGHHDAGPDIRLTPTEWHLLEVLLRNPGKLLSQRQLLTKVWGPGYAEAAGNLRLYMAQLRRKLEPDPARPRWLITEPGMGYRYQPGPDEEPP